jgi:hypothetical protein
VQPDPGGHRSVVLSVKKKVGGTPRRARVGLLVGSQVAQDRLETSRNLVASVGFKF